jgi:hypothetical protein
VASGLNFSAYAGIAVDPQGRVYGINHSGGYTVYDPATNTSLANNTVSFYYEGGIAVDPQGRVYGINRSGGYTVYDPATNTSLANNSVSFFSQGGIAVSAVPLPASVWLFGSGLLGVARKKA